MATFTAYSVETQHPDEFIHHLVDLATGPVCVAVHAHRRNLRNPSKTIAEYLATLERHSLPETVAALRTFKDLL